MNTAFNIPQPSILQHTTIQLSTSEQKTNEQSTSKPTTMEPITPETPTASPSTYQSLITSSPAYYKTTTINYPSRFRGGICKEKLTFDITELTAKSPWKHMTKIQW